MHMETKNDIFNEYKEEYWTARIQKQGGRAICTRILDTVCEVTRLGRKSAIRKFNRLQTKETTKDERRGRPESILPTSRLP